MYDQRGLIRSRSKDESDTTSKTSQTSVPSSDVIFFSERSSVSDTTSIGAMHRMGVETSFQARYKSEPVEDMEYLKTVFRYIHQNPLCAGIEAVLGTYPWSSYHDYVALNSSFVDIEKILNLFPSYADCMKHLNAISDKKCMENYSYVFSDTQALEMIQQKTSCKSPSDFQRLPLLERNHYLKMLYHSGISVRQLSRLTGISRTAVRTVIQELQ